MTDNSPYDGLGDQELQALLRFAGAQLVKPQAVHVTTPDYIGDMQRVHGRLKRILAALEANSRQQFPEAWKDYDERRERLYGKKASEQIRQIIEGKRTQPNGGKDGTGGY